jgi:hypothetical protein
MNVAENIYPNNVDTAARIGWTLVPEYCIGDKSSPWIFHDYPNGKFYYLDDDQKSELLSGGREVECIVGVCETCNEEDS